VAFEDGPVMSKKKLLEDMKQNPQRFYRSPADVVRDRRFSDAERLEILVAWETLALSETAELEQVAEVLREIERKLADAQAPLIQKQ
jgi:hypothetical protein